MDGMIAVNKAAGMTSHDVVGQLRRILKTKKIGHGGTLDPQVTGVLPIAVGKATRLIEYMQDGGKIYEGEITLGYATTTEDAWGERIQETPIQEGQVTLDQIDAAMATLEGTIQQIPPMYSAVKVKGRKLYEYARAGEEVERPVRQVAIQEFSRQSELRWENGLVRFDFRVSCSKGTYVRTLAVDLGSRLGFSSHMSRLVRTQSAGLSLESAYRLEAIEELVAQGQETFLLPLEYGVSSLPAYELSREETEELRYGRWIQAAVSQNRVAAFYEGKLLAILEKKGDMFKPHKVFV
ncbi:MULTISPECIES: tRNA pseudouridine(55) synthase TruB [unclassified Streptococcus]|uniref:tRNA pseudouridine(55) synthase TruB n=1 Tax=unclassified Streptococcus TaxID=2608887 RepID=UPI0010716D74|nr:MULTISPECIES: tRNA pseudouridine(55) synthase TruB [unclassified Streptococcus]MBF0806044.1 tRNA pseudouridine(55) synthase TruB [Streptococcus sp. 19428wA2_WM07]TFU28389.1 tRNA pseudouridine(55) synthase TruB [Streptococcus sp. WM07]